MLIKKKCVQLGCPPLPRYLPIATITICIEIYRLSNVGKRYRPLSAHLHFVLLFWNQVFTWASVIFRFFAIWALHGNHSLFLALWSFFRSIKKIISAFAFPDFTFQCSPSISVCEIASLTHIFVTCAGNWINYMLKEISSPRKRGSGLFPFWWSPVLVRVANSSGRERHTFFL